MYRFMKWQHPAQSPLVDEGDHGLEVVRLDHAQLQAQSKEQTGNDGTILGQVLGTNKKTCCDSFKLVTKILEITTQKVT